MHLNELDYNLPQELIALHPKKPRDQSNLIVTGKKDRIIKFKDIIQELSAYDTLVFNDTKVIKADLDGFFKNKKISINLNKLEDKEKNIWSAFIKSKQELKLGDKIIFSECFSAKIRSVNYDKGLTFYYLDFNQTIIGFKRKIGKFGKAPLPPYIKKKRKYKQSDIEDYQTVFAKKEGAVAAPTASLHFTKKLITKLKKKKIKIVKITLHINGGTFLPIKTNLVSKHSMHFETGFISRNAANEINKTKIKGGKVVAVGTTVLRLLESSKDKNGFIKPFRGQTNIFIKPGWEINSIDGIITNLHTPRSTLLLLIYALLGKKKTQELYNLAIKKRLRFFSYGDASLIWRNHEKI